MSIATLNYLSKIKITNQNCDEIIAESLELLKQASKVKVKKLESELRSSQIKRGIAQRRKLESMSGAKR